MTDRGPLYDPDETPEDVATLYSWANLHGAKYRDFSASRAETREKARLRVQQAMEEEQARMLQQSGQPPAADFDAELPRAAHQAAAEEERRREAFVAQQAAQQASERAVHEAAQQASEQARQQAADLAAQQAAQRAAQQSALFATRQAAEHAAQEIARLAARQAAEQATLQAAQQAAELAAQKAAADQAAQRAAQLAAEQAQAAQRAAQQAEAAQRELAAHRAAQQAEAARHAAQQAAWQQTFAGSYPAAPPAEPAMPFVPPAAPHYPPFDFPGAPAASQRPASTQPQYPPMREANYPPAQRAWAAGDSREAPGRPAWLNPDRPEVAAPPVMPSAPEDTLQGSRERLASRWYALRSLFDGPAPAEAVPAPVASRAPVVAVFSLAGGVGKTSVVATLGRALSARGERVLLVDTAPYGLLPFFFGACDQRPGLLRTFSPPGMSSDAPIQMITIDPEGLGPDSAGQETLVGEISTHARGVGRVIVDLATASGATTRRIMRMAPLVVVPMIPDMNSVVSVSSIDSFFQHNGGPVAKPSLPYYVLNQFDPSLPLHLDIREVLREQLGDRLLPFVIRRAPAVSEALAEGMTVMDYAPNSTVAEDFGSLAGWVKSQSAPASTTYRGVRWSER